MHDLTRETSEAVRRELTQVLSKVERLQIRDNGDIILSVDPKHIRQIAAALLIHIRKQIDAGTN